MAPHAPITVTLDGQKREIRWTNGADFLNGTLSPPATVNKLRRQESLMYALCAFVWASLVDDNIRPEAPKDLADNFDTDEKQLAAVKAIVAMLTAAREVKKNRVNEATSTNGQTPSSTLDAVPALSTTGN